MKGKTKAVVGPSEAVSEAIENKDMQEPVFPVLVSKEPRPETGVIGFDVKPSELVSIVAGNRLLMLESGVVEITVRYMNK